MDIGILTIIDNNNYGNRLQNYALQEYLKKTFSANVYSIYNNTNLNSRNKYIMNYFKHCKHILLKNFKKNNKKRIQNFLDFNKKIIFYKKNINAFSKINDLDYVVCGSDQIWNPNFGRLKDVDMLCFVDKQKRISYAASFGISNLPLQYSNYIKKELSDFKCISVREDAGKKIIEEIVGRNDVEVSIDPTMLLNDEDWDKVSKKPKMLKSDRYILNYFLGDLSMDKQGEINRIAEENNCEVINLLDVNSPFYECGPSEFLWLEKHAFLICTDSFHSSVFAILYNRPFLIFERDQEGVVNMNSRLETLIKKFRLKDRKFDGIISDKNLLHDYSEAFKILDDERRKSKDYFNKSFEV